MAIAIVLHVLAAVIWVGGMFFAYVCLRPVAASLLEAPLRLALWRQSFRRFFLWVWAAIVVLPGSGIWLANSMYGAIGDWPWHVHTMMGIGIIMIMIFLHVFFAPYRRLARLLEAADYGSAGKQLARIRKLVLINLSLGLMLIAVASGGRFLGTPTY